jgi:hypothetical protein
MPHHADNRKSAMTHQSSFTPSVPILLVAVSVCMALLSSCKNSQNKILPEAEKRAKLNARVKKAVHNALAANTNAESQAWRAFLTHWPGARQYDGYAWDRALEKFRADVTATAIIEDRYVFKIILSCTASVDGQEVVFQQLRFRFFEVQAVRLPAKGAGHGGTITTFQPDQKWFELKEWNQLVEANWNFCKIGITIVSNAPIPNIRAVPNL